MSKDKSFILAGFFAVVFYGIIPLPLTESLLIHYILWKFFHEPQIDQLKNIKRHKEIQEIQKIIDKHENNYLNN